MITRPLIILACVFLHSCGFGDNKIDLEKAKQPVVLDSNNLAVFSSLHHQLMSDSLAILQQCQTSMAVNSRGWMTTNSYYLKQIDSSRYVALYDRLKGKFVDNIHIHRNGNTIFTIKSNVETHWDNYNESYIHKLVSVNSDSIQTIYGDIDTVYIDSVVNKDWRYVFYKALTGH